MKVTLLALLLLSTIECITSSATDSDSISTKCTGFPRKCQNKSSSPRRTVWVANHNDSYCYNISVTDCDGIGFPNLQECYIFCIATYR
ncbi:hypothetical protein MRX96_015434 [Rhipicephalus microplus]